MAQIGDRLMAVLEVIAFQELFGIMGTYPIERFADGIGRAGIAGKRIGAFFRREWSDGDDSFQAAMVAD